MVALFDKFSFRYYSKMVGIFMKTASWRQAYHDFKSSTATITDSFLYFQYHLSFAYIKKKHSSNLLQEIKEYFFLDFLLRVSNLYNKERFLWICMSGYVPRFHFSTDFKTEHFYGLPCHWGSCENYFGSNWCKNKKVLA